MMYRTKWLMVLLLLALASIVAALWAVYTRPLLSPPPQALLFPQLEQALERLDSVRVVYGLGLSGTAAATLRRQQNGRFVVAEYSNYPADEARLTRMLNGLKDARPLARRTASPQWHGRLGLGDPRELGEAVEVQLRDTAGVVFAGLLIGKTQSSEALARQANMRAQSLRQMQNIYVRRIGEAQSFLLAAPWPPTQRVQDWLNPVLPGFAVDDVQRLRIMDGTRNILAERASIAEPFRIKDAGHIADDKILALFDSLAGLKIEAVAPASATQALRRSAQVTLTGFDGTALRLDIAQAGAYGQVRFFAQGSPKADTWQSRYGDWLYRFAWGSLGALLLR